MPRKTLLLITLTVAAAAVAAVIVGTAVGAGPTSTVQAVHSATLGETVAADRHGRTLYRLSGESSHHLICRSAACTAIWPPLTVASRHVKLRAGSGVHGKLGLIRRPGGKLQVTLRGLPLYRYSGDSARGDANGQGIRSFGGTWTAVPASTAASSPAPTPTTPTTSTPQPPIYPGY